MWFLSDYCWHIVLWNEFISILFCYISHIRHWKKAEVWNTTMVTDGYSIYICEIEVANKNPVWLKISRERSDLLAVWLILGFHCSWIIVFHFGFNFFNVRKKVEISYKHQWRIINTEHVKYSQCHTPTQDPTS